jgi:hypothetical protein
MLFVFLKKRVQLTTSRQSYNHTHTNTNTYTNKNRNQDKEAKSADCLAQEGGKLSSEIQRSNGHERQKRKGGVEGE